MKQSVNNNNNNNNNKNNNNNNNNNNDIVNIHQYFYSMAQQKCFFRFLSGLTSITDLMAVSNTS